MDHSSSRTMNGSSTVSSELLLAIEHVKYRRAGDGRSPIGCLSIYRDFIEWRDSSNSNSTEKLHVKFTQIKGQRVSQPQKSRVQLQLVFHNEDQATFVFLNPTKDKEALTRERDDVKETLQQALNAHRTRINQLAAANETLSKTAELETKKKILSENHELDQMYTHLVGTGLVTPQEFWNDYSKKTSGSLEEKSGINGAFLANIVRQEGANGVRLNLNPEIIQSIFNTYPAVEQKHLELVPHELKEEQFWSKFFQSHYFHREREVLPNPNDPFADCARKDETHMTKLVDDAVVRKRVDLNQLDDNVFKEFVQKPEVGRKSAKTTLIKRCNYLSEKILSNTSLNFDSAIQSTSKASDPVGASTSNGGDSQSASQPPPPNGYALLKSLLTEEEERLESDELRTQKEDNDVQLVKIDEASISVSKAYSPEIAQHYKQNVLDFLEEYDTESLLKFDGSSCAIQNGVEKRTAATNGTSSQTAASENPSFTIPPTELRVIHEACCELLRHFWSCFPPTTQEHETKMERMVESLKKFAATQLAESKAQFGEKNVKHMHSMIDLALARYAAYIEKRKK